jgi:hypothetical protein
VTRSARRSADSAARRSRIWGAGASGKRGGGLACRLPTGPEPPAYQATPNGKVPGPEPVMNGTAGDP